MMFMRFRFFGGGVGLFLALFLFSHAFGIAHADPAHDDPLLSQLVDHSDLILRGQVLSHDSFWDEAHRLILTDSVIKIDQIYQGTAETGAGNTLVVRTLGGELPAENIGMRASHSPELPLGTRRILFLRRTPPTLLSKSADQHVYFVTGGDRGSWIDSGDFMWLPSIGVSQSYNRFWDAITTEGQGNGRFSVWEWQRPASSAWLLSPSSGPAPTSFVYNGVKWPTNTVTYRVNVNSSQIDQGDGSAADFLNNIRSAAATWSAVSTADFSFVYGGSTSHTDVGYNGSNDVMFISDGSFDGTLAQATWWYNSNNEILEADFYYDDDTDWDATGAPDNNEFDVQSVGLHEFGHWLSLGHDSSSAAVMYAYTNAGVTKRALSQNDKDGITYIYPLSATSTPTPAPTATSTPTPAPTATSTPTSAPTATSTPTSAPTATSTSTPAPTATSTSTPAPTATFTPTPAPTATFTPTSAPTATFTPTPAPTATSTPTSAPTATSTLTPAPTATSTLTPAPTATSTPLLTPTATPTATPTVTPTPTPYRLWMPVIFI